MTNSKKYPEIKMVYLVHEFGGEYDDSFDNIIGIFDELEDAINLVDVKRKQSEIDFAEAQKEYQETGSWDFTEYCYNIGVLPMNKEGREKRLDD